MTLPPDHETAASSHNEEILAIARAMVGADATINVLRDGSRVADGTAIMLVQAPRFAAVLQISPTAFPHVVSKGCERARAFAEALGLALGSPVLLPLREGSHEGRSFAILPFRQPFSRSRLWWWMQRAQVTPAVLDWLARLAGCADVRLDSPGSAALYVHNLSALRALCERESASEIARAAGQAIGRVEQGDTEPRIMPMHGDLWLGNILMASKDSGFPFSVIDWGGSQVKGYPMFDLIRIAQSYNLGSARIGREIRRHNTTLGCSLADSEVHLLAALGHYANNLGEMKPSNFISMARSSFVTYQHACATM